MRVASIDSLNESSKEVGLEEGDGLEERISLNKVWMWVIVSGVAKPMFRRWVLNLERRLFMLEVGISIIVILI